MDIVVKDTTGEDIPTPTKDEPLIPKICTSQNPRPSDDPNTGIQSSDLLDESRDSITPTLDELPSDTDCPTPTLDEPVDTFKETSDEGSLTVEKVKCILFDKETNDKDKSSKSGIKISSEVKPGIAGKETSTNTKDDKLVSKPKKECNSEIKIPLEKAMSNGSVTDSFGKRRMSKSLLNEGTGGNEDQKQIAVTCDGILFTCNECDYIGKGHHFEEHLMCHLIHKPYQCLYCKEAFASRREIHKHLSSMHKGKKLNCMLKALNRAKTLMLEAQKTNSCVFFALVPGSELKLQRNLSTESSGSTCSLSRTSSDSDGSQKSTCSLPPSKQTSQLSDTDVKESSAPDDGEQLLQSKEMSNDSVSDAEASRMIKATIAESETVHPVKSNISNEGSECVQSDAGKEVMESFVYNEVAVCASTEVNSGSGSAKNVTETVDDLAANKKSSKADKEEIEVCSEQDDSFSGNKSESLSAKKTALELKKNDTEEVADVTLTITKENVPGADEYVTEEMDTEKTDEVDQASAEGEVETAPQDTSKALDNQEKTIVTDKTEEVIEKEDIQQDEDLCGSKTDAKTETITIGDSKLIPSTDDTVESEKTVLESDQVSVEDSIQSPLNDQSLQDSGQCILETRTDHAGDDLNADKENICETADSESNPMCLKIVASFSLDGDDYSKCEDTKGDSGATVEPQQSVDLEVTKDDSSQSEPQQTVDSEKAKGISSEIFEPQQTVDSEKATDDTSGLVIDVFKDGRIAVHDTNTSSSVADKIENSPQKNASDNISSVDAEPESQPKLHQTKLGQLLTSFGSDSGLNQPSLSASGAISDASGNAASSVAVPNPSTSSANVMPTQTQGQAQPATTQGLTPAQIKHMRNPNFYVCGLNCNFSCLNSVEFRDHLFLGHAGEKSFPCYYCGWMAHTEESLLRHITNHAHTYSKTAPLYLCGMHRCRFGTNLLSDLLNHMQILHQDITLYICKECNDTFSDVKDLVSHFEENFIHVVNCPHCACKGTDRRMILRHIAEYHPGKAKMVSVAKQIICKDRKINNYKQVRAQYKNGAGGMAKRPSTTEALASPEKRLLSGYTSLKQSEKAGQLKAVSVKIENTSREGDYGSVPATTSSSVNDATPHEKQINAPKCSHCTFVARDQRRLESHVKCHGLPVIKRHRFRCLYCPQGFDSSQKFRLHINCHPGLIKYWMYYCKRCDFDTNQRYVMLRHIRTRDELHFNESNEEDMFTVVERIIESRVLECEHCNYQTRHKLHLQIHYQREHKVVKAAAHSSCEPEKYKVNQLSPQVPWTSPTHSSSSTDSCQENMSKKFKCPFCRYLVPKAADLKSHVKKHANLGKITIDFLRCRYCSLSSTARNIVYSHIREKHAGKPLVLVRKIVTLDCSGNDNSFSETSVTEAPLTVTSSGHSIDRFQCETCSFATTDRREFESHVQLHNTTKGGIHGMSMEEDSDEDEDDNEDEMETGVDHPQPDDDDDNNKPEVAPAPEPSPVDLIEQVYVLPETVAGDQLSSPARCCNCYYASGYRSAFIDHMTTNHPTVMLVVRNKGTTVEQICPNGRMFFGLPVTLNNEVLLVPDRQVFTQAVKCPKCPNFATYFRRNLVLHLSKDHSEITAMGKCTWPGWQASCGSTSSAPATATSTNPKPKTPKKSVKSPENKEWSCIIGSGDLDEQIGCLYKNFGDRQQCLICNSEKPKKFFMHIHILRHLNIFLAKCPYCPHKGLQKYKVSRHIKTNHPERENIVKELKNDVPKKVADFLAHQKKVVAAAAASPSFKQSSMASFIRSGDSPHVSPKTEKGDHAVNKMSGPLGTPNLDEKLLCLYTPVNGKNKCNLCSVEFTRKYAIHRHIVVNHLKVALLKCGHCNFQGVEKHVIIDHILEQHKDQQIQFEPLKINMEEKVQEFLKDYNVVKSEPGVSEMELSLPVSPQKFSGPQAYCLGKDKLHNKLAPLLTRKGESFKCNLCKWKFPRKYAIHRHILMKHLKIGLYGCTHCHVQGAEKYIVVSHMKEAHPKVPPQARMLEVDMDQRIQEVLQESVTGTGNHTSGRMPVTYNYDTPDDADNETAYADMSADSNMKMETEEPDQKQMVVAMFGKKRKSPEPTVTLDTSVTPKKLKTTSRMVDVSTKIRVVCVEDGTYKKYVCEKCRFTSLHRSNVYRHVLRIHERYRELQCDFCGYKTYSKVLMDQHMEVDHDGISSSPVDTKKEMTANIKQEHNSMEEDSKSDVTTASTSSRPMKHYACAYCNFETSTAESIIKHTRENHAPGGGEPRQKAAPEKSTSTSKSSVTVSSHEYVVKKSSVKRGTFTESQMLYCGFCTFKAPGVQAVKDHHKAKHQPNKLCIISPQPWRYICRVCGLKNNAGSKMRCHLNRHLEYRPYACSSCSQCYASTDELRKHVRNLRHSDNFQYLKHEKKEQKINRYLEESRKNALLVNIGAPPDEESMGTPMATVSRIDEILNLKEPSPSPQPKFKGIKRTMKMPVSPTKSLKKKYWQAGLDRESKAITKDIACHWCDIPHTVSVDQMKQHHSKEHPDKDFLWVDTRQGNTCGATGEIVIPGNLMETPKMADVYTVKQLANNKMKYYCNRCSFSAWYRPAMISHCRCHQPKKYICAYCHLRYSNRDYLEKHQKNFHPSRDPWILHMVEDESDTPQRPKSATVTTDTMKESVESSKASTPAPVDERRASQTVTYSCNFCSYKNESLYQYRLHLPVHGTFKHLKTDLSNDSPLKCGFCPYVAQDQTDFSLHITTHFENRSYKCSHCSYSAYTRAHVKFHLANQHPDMEQLILDLSSAATYVEYLKADSTNLPKLVNLDPRVVLKDIKTMTQTDLEALMTEELSKVLNRSYDKDEDEDVDVEGLDEESSSKSLPINRALFKDSLEQQSADQSLALNNSSSQEVQDVDSSMEPEMEPAEDADSPDQGSIKSGQDDISDKQDASMDKGDLSGVVSSSVGIDEDGVGDGFDIAEVSAFVDDAPVTSKETTAGKTGDEANNTASLKSSENSADSIVCKVNGESSEDVDDVDGDFESRDKEASSSKDVSQSGRDRSPDSEDKTKKDDSANVFDTLHSWLSMK